MCSAFMAMPRRKNALAGSIVALGLLLAACRGSPAARATPTPPPTVPAATASVAGMLPPPPAPTDGPAADENPVPTAIPFTPTPAPPTPTPLPVWPARWEPTGGPPGGTIAFVIIDPEDSNLLYAGGLGGAVYSSADGGETWSVGERIVPAHCPFSGLIMDPRPPATLYASSPCNGILVSADRGGNWAYAGSELNAGVTSLVQSPHAPELLLAGTQEGLIYRSRDGAKTWEAIQAGLPAEPAPTIEDLIASGPDSYWLIASNPDGNVLYRFTAGVWSVARFDPPADAQPVDILVDPLDPAIIYLALEGKARTGDEVEAPYLFRSNDGGLSWNPLPDPLSLVAPEEAARVDLLAVDPASGRLYVAAGGALFVTPDQTTWEPLETPSGAGSAAQVAIDPNAPQVLYLSGADHGLLKSTDGGHTWRNINQGIDSLNIALIATHPQDPATLYAAAPTGSTLFKSSDYGDHWTRVENGATGPVTGHGTAALLLDPQQPARLYQLLDDARAFQSDDAGATWAASWPGFRLSDVESLVTVPSDPNILYASEGGRGLFRSDDGGATWRMVPGVPGVHTAALAVHPADPNFVLSGEMGGVVRRSRDGGRTGQIVLEVDGAAAITSVAIDPRVEPYFPRGKQPADPTRLYAASSGSRGQVWYSNDAGEAWKPLNPAFNFTNVRVLAAAPRRPGVVYAAVWGGGTWRTQDAGQTWERVPGDPALSAAGVAIDPTNENVIYIADATAPRIYRSVDGGDHWETVFDGAGSYEHMGALALAPSDPNVLYASAYVDAVDAAAGDLLRIDASASPGENMRTATGDLPGIPTTLAVHRGDSRRVYAGVPGAGLWKTLDDGATWRQMYGAMAGATFTELVVDPVWPDILFAAGGEYSQPEGEGSASPDPDALFGIWKSTDDGATWTRVGATTFGRSSGPVRAIAFHPDDDRVMYAAGEGGVYLSPDRGETWTAINGRLPFFPMNALASDGATLYAGTSGAGVFEGAIHPLIHTADWEDESHLAVPIYHIQIALHPGAPEILYASAYPGGVYRTLDGGATWHALNRGLPSFPVTDPWRQGYYALALAPSAPDVLYLGLYGRGVFRSIDGGRTWRPAYGAGAELHAAKIASLLVHPDDPNVIFAATEEALWRSVNAGESWADFGPGLPNGDAQVLALGGQDRLYAAIRGYELFTRGAFLLEEQSTWTQLPPLGGRTAPRPGGNQEPPYQHTTLLSPPGQPDTLYVGTFPGGVYMSTDAGLTWRERSAGLGTGGVLAMLAHPQDPRILYAGTTSGLARSVDGGATWHAWDSGWPAQQWVTDIAIDATNPQNLYACTGGEGRRGVVMKSTDGGAVWREITTGLSPEQGFVAILVDRFDPSVLYLATRRDGIFISHDAGESWTSWNEGLWNPVAGAGEQPVADVLAPSADGRLLYFGTAGSGVWRRPAATTP
jgi:photosystem II stability/assembly factor-like uncharacterized protein